MAQYIISISIDERELNTVQYFYSLGTIQIMENGISFSKKYHFLFPRMILFKSYNAIQQSYNLTL